MKQLVLVNNYFPISVKNNFLKEHLIFLVKHSQIRKPKKVLGVLVFSVKFVFLTFYE